MAYSNSISWVSILSVIFLKIEGCCIVGQTTSELYLDPLNSYSLATQQLPSLSTPDKQPLNSEFTQIHTKIELARIVYRKLKGLYDGFLNIQNTCPLLPREADSYSYTNYERVTCS